MSTNENLCITCTYRLKAQKCKFNMCKTCCKSEDCQRHNNKKVKVSENECEKYCYDLEKNKILELFHDILPKDLIYHEIILIYCYDLEKNKILELFHDSDV